MLKFALFCVLSYYFYVKNGFKPLINDIDDDSYTVPMYYDLKELLG